MSRLYVRPSDRTSLPAMFPPLLLHFLRFPSFFFLLPFRPKQTFSFFSGVIPVTRLSLPFLARKGGFSFSVQIMRGKKKNKKERRKLRRGKRPKGLSKEKKEGKERYPAFFFLYPSTSSHRATIADSCAPVSSFLPSFSSCMHRKTADWL